MIADITFLSIFRDSMSYLWRYGEQIKTAIQLFNFQNVRVVWLEGDSRDNTYETLKNLGTSLGADTILTKFDTGSRRWQSVDHLDRWELLASCWNRNLFELRPSKICVCVESDLLWSPQALGRCIQLLNDYDVIYPALMCAWNPIQFYDIHGFVRNNKHFSPMPPYVPDWDGSVLVSVDTGGGMIVTREDNLTQAFWNPTSCVLEFPPETRKILDLDTKIYHP